ncbi:MAG: ABC transporter ATP-binding protein [Bilophila sp.]
MCGLAPKVLCLTRVGKVFGSRAVLQNISLEVHPGTVSLLIGSNGAGKTTLLKIMAGLMRPDAGSVERTCADGKLGYLGHATFIYPGLSAFENLAFWDKAHGQASGKARILAVLERVELTRFAEERAGTFSRGMAQRLNLARILLQQPRLLLLDEPGTGLDVRSLSLLHREIALARTDGVAVVWITHDAASDALCADRIIALADRRIAYDGAVSAYPASPPSAAPAPRVATGQEGVC